MVCGGLRDYFGIRCVRFGMRPSVCCCCARARVCVCVVRVCVGARTRLCCTRMRVRACVTRASEMHTHTHTKSATPRDYTWCRSGREAGERARARMTRVRSGKRQQRRSPEVRENAKRNGGGRQAKSTSNTGARACAYVTATTNNNTKTTVPLSPPRPTIC